MYPVQLTTSRIANLTRLIHTLLQVMTIHTYTVWGATNIIPGYQVLLLPQVWMYKNEELAASNRKVGHLTKTERAEECECKQCKQHSTTKLVRHKRDKRHKIKSSKDGTRRGGYQEGAAGTLSLSSHSTAKTLLHSPPIIALIPYK